MFHKPIIGPSPNEWDPPLTPECPHGLPFSVSCQMCQHDWYMLSLWGELMDEA